MHQLAAGLLAACAVVLFAGPAASSEMISCRLKYDLKGWAFVYQTAKGSGLITCSDGQKVDVSIVAHGVGAALGTFDVTGGKGAFSAVRDIRDLYGTYAEATANAGVGRSGGARAMVKLRASLSLAGTGQGVNVGVALGGFSIEPK